MKPGNISYYQSEVYCVLGCLGLACILPYCWYSTRTKFTVRANHFAMVKSDSGDRPKTEIYGPGYHFLGRY